MGRREKPVDQLQGELAAFALDLRSLRNGTPDLTYRRLAALTHYSPSTLARAATGNAIPTLAVVLAYVTACGGNVEAWQARWNALNRDRTAADNATRDNAIRDNATRDNAEPVVDSARDVPDRPRQLPYAVANFVGRLGELAMLPSSPPRGTGGATVVWAISGAPGVGKTTLAVHVGHRLATEYPDGQLFADLRGMDVAPVESMEVQRRFLQSLGLGGDLPTDPEVLTAAYRTALADRRCIILLDNAAHEDQVRPLIPAGSSCLVLITSRSRLAGLDCPRFLGLAPLAVAEARELLARIAPAQISGESDSVDELIELCGWLPLAIRIIGAQLATGLASSTAGLVVSLRDEHHRVRQLTVGDASVRASFTLSYLKLPTDVRAVFRRLGRFPGPELTPLIAALLAEVGLDEAERTLSYLQQASLIERANQDRYALHDLLRLFAEEQSHIEDDPQEFDTAARNMVAYMADSAVNAAMTIRPTTYHLPAPEPSSGCPSIPLSFADYDAALAWLTAERTNLLAIARFAANRGYDRQAARLAAELRYLFDLEGSLTDWISITETGLVSARQAGDLDAESHLLRSLAVAFSRSLRYSEALATQTSALELCRRIGDRRGEAAALANLGITYCYLGRIADAIQTIQLAAALCLRLGDTVGVGLAYSNIAWVCDDHAGRSEDAIDWCHRALDAFGDDPRGQSLVLTNLASTYRRLGKLDDAIENARQAVDAHRRTGHREGQAIALQHLAEALDEAGRRSEARPCWAECMSIFEALHDPRHGQARDQLEAHT